MVVGYRKAGYRNAGASFLCAAVLLSLLLRSHETAEAVGVALTRCCRSVLPALFPAMCVCGAFIKCGGASIAGRRINGGMQKLFGVGGEEMSALLCGFLCGYPVGARCVGELSLRREHSGDCTRLVCACSAASPAFVFGVVGASWGLGFAATLYLTVVFTALVYLACTNKRNAAAAAQKVKALPFTEAVVTAVKEAAVNCLYIVGFIVFFGVLCELLTPLTDLLGGRFTAFFAAFFEFSRAVELSSHIGMKAFGAALTGFAAAFGGMSVVAQTVCVISPRFFSAGRYIIFKLIQGAVTAAVCLVYVKLFPAAADIGIIAASADVNAFVPAGLAPVVLCAVGCYFMKLSK